MWQDEPRVLIEVPIDEEHLPPLAETTPPAVPNASNALLTLPPVDPVPLAEQAHFLGEDGLQECTPPREPSPFSNNGLSTPDKGYYLTVHCGPLTGRLHLQLFVCPGVNALCIELNRILITPTEFTLRANMTSLNRKTNSCTRPLSIRLLMETKDIDFYNHKHLCTGKCHTYPRRKILGPDGSPPAPVLPTDPAPVPAPKIRHSPLCHTKPDNGYSITVHCGPLTGRLYLHLFVCPGLYAHCIELNERMVSPKVFTLSAKKNFQDDNKANICAGPFSLRFMMDTVAIDFYSHKYLCSGKCKDYTTRTFFEKIKFSSPLDPYFTTMCDPPQRYTPYPMPMPPAQQSYVHSQNPVVCNTSPQDFPSRPVNPKLIYNVSASGDSAYEDQDFGLLETLYGTSTSSSQAPPAIMTNEHPMSISDTDPGMFCNEVRSAGLMPDFLQMIVDKVAELRVTASDLNHKNGIVAPTLIRLMETLDLKPTMVSRIQMSYNGGMPCGDGGSPALKEIAYNQAANPYEADAAQSFHDFPFLENGDVDSEVVMGALALQENANPVYEVRRVGLMPEFLQMIVDKVAELRITAADLNHDIGNVAPTLISLMDTLDLKHTMVSRIQTTYNSAMPSGYMGPLALQENANPINNQVANSFEADAARFLRDFPFFFENDAADSEGVIDAIEHQNRTNDAPPTLAPKRRRRFIIKHGSDDEE